MSSRSRRRERSQFPTQQRSRRHAVSFTARRGLHPRLFPSGLPLFHPDARSRVLRAPARFRLISSPRRFQAEIPYRPHKPVRSLIRTGVGDTLLHPIKQKSANICRKRRTRREVLFAMGHGGKAPKHKIFRVSSLFKCRS